ncbi:MAG: hypothetical protein H8D78_21205 [Chloroflexi bacterium]|nr:hypothetical protein [Chloroflexota bacterium]
MSPAVLEMEASTMVITWPKELLNRIQDIARRRSIEAEELVVETVDRHLQTPGAEASSARQELREALSRIGQPVDMMSLLREVRQEAYDVVQAHEDWELHLGGW